MPDPNQTVTDPAGTQAPTGTQAPAAGGTDNASKVGADGKPVPASSGQPEGGAVGDPAKPDPNKPTGQTGIDNDGAYRLRYTHLQSHASKLEARALAAEKRLAELTAGKPTAPTGDGKTPEETVAADPDQAFDGWTYRARLLADAETKAILKDIEEEAEDNGKNGKAAVERELRRLINQGRLHHKETRALREETADLKAKTVMTDLQTEFEAKHPELATDPQLFPAFKAKLEEMGGKANDPLQIMEFALQLAQLDHLPEIVDAMVADGIKKGVQREIARLKAGGTTAGGGAPGAMPGGSDADNQTRMRNLLMLKK
jgi:hypothetical protein